MRVVSLNVNGIRAAVRRGLFEWVAEKRPELICLQEIRATQSQLALREFERLGYESIWNLGSRPGYSGVGILSRIGFEPVVDLLDDPATERTSDSQGTGGTPSERAPHPLTHASSPTRDAYDEGLHRRSLWEARAVHGAALA